MRLPKNPIYAHKRLANYRMKVLEKEHEKEALIWPAWLENAFLDAKGDIDDYRSFMKGDENPKTFRDNQVLISIANGHLPNERPNYEYFARLLDADNDVFLRPKQCWILNQADYSHFGLDDRKDYKAFLSTGGHSTVLLHEYTRTLSQRGSSSVRNISDKWGILFPEFQKRLDAALNDTLPSQEQTSRCVMGPCDTFHLEVALDLHSNPKFPAGSKLNVMVELSVSRPDLYNHAWKSVTSVIKLDALCLSDSEPKLWDHARLAPYLNTDKERKEGEQSFCEADQTPSRAQRGAVPWGGEDESSPNDDESLVGKTLTLRKLLERVAMYQEIWSVPKECGIKVSGNHLDAPRNNWTRRAVLLWSFKPAAEQTKGRKIDTAAAGTTWRFLTKVDPTSEYHQQRAYLGGTPHVSRSSVSSFITKYAHYAGKEAIGVPFNRDCDNVSECMVPDERYAHVTGWNLSSDLSNRLATLLLAEPFQSNNHVHSLDNLAGTTALCNGTLHCDPSLLSYSGPGNTFMGIDTKLDHVMAVAAPVNCASASLSWAAQADIVGVDGTQWSAPYVNDFDKGGFETMAGAYAMLENEHLSRRGRKRRRVDSPEADVIRELDAFYENKQLRKVHQAEKKAKENDKKGEKEKEEMEIVKKEEKPGDLRPYVPGQIIHGFITGSSRRTPVLPDGLPGWIKEPDAVIGSARDKTVPLLFEVAWSQDAEDLENKIADYADLCGKVRAVITFDMEYRAPRYLSRLPPPDARLCLYRFTYETDADTGEIIYAMDLASELKHPSPTFTTSGSNQKLGDLILTLQDFTPLALATEPDTVYGEPKSTMQAIQLATMMVDVNDWYKTW
ncbi:hypothetical protein DL767_006696 [Monosporascus sp. MG133]|nr:hypothetical protein DL767_006696 [Monosporascus sp. MG133]